MSYLYRWKRYLLTIKLTQEIFKYFEKLRHEEYSLILELFISSFLTQKRVCS